MFFKKKNNESSGDYLSELSAGDLRNLINDLSGLVDELRNTKVRVYTKEVSKRLMALEGKVDEMLVEVRDQSESINSVTRIVEETLDAPFADYASQISKTISAFNEELRNRDLDLQLVYKKLNDISKSIIGKVIKEEDTK